MSKIMHGIDLVDDSKVEANSKVFHPSELASNKLPSIFALKEAVIKALGIKSHNWLEIEVEYSSGIPQIKLSKQIEPAGFKSITCSVSHENGLTIGSVIIICD